MELCTPQAFSNLPNHRFAHSNRAHLQWKPSLLLSKSPKCRFNSGLLYRRGSAIRSTSEESSSFTSQFVKDEPDGFATVESSRKVKETEAYELYVPPVVEKEVDGAVQNETPIEDSMKVEQTDAYKSLIYEPPKVEEKDDGAVQNETPIEDSTKDEQTDAYKSLIYEPPKVEDKNDGSVQSEAPVEDSALDFQLPEFFDRLNIKFDPEDSSSIFLLGGGAVVALWLTTAVVGAIDSIPLFPKLLEVVGLGYTVWFSTRYLIFKKNRDELAAKIEELKQEVLGSNKD